MKRRRPRRATKLEILQFIEGKRIIFIFDLVERFGYTYYSAVNRLHCCQPQGAHPRAVRYDCCQRGASQRRRILLLFLNKQDDHFTILGGLMGAKYIIDDGRVRYGMYGYSPWEPLDEAVARIKAVAETWADEELTPERETEVIGIAMNYISEYLAGRNYETKVGPYTRGIEPGIIRYLVSIYLREKTEIEQELLAQGAVISEVSLGHSISIENITGPDGVTRKEGSVKATGTVFIELGGGSLACHS